jgi:hypothetical protein
MSPSRYGEDEDEDQEQILKMLGGEVDDFAGKQLSDPDDGRFEKGPPAGGTTITISVTPGSQGPSDKGPEDEENAGGADKETDEEEEKDEPHDPIAHILGMCGGGCPY